MPYLRNYNLFISHAWKYGDDYKRLVNMLDSKDFFTYRNYSAPLHKPLQNLNATDAITKKQIHDAIARKIEHAHIVIILSGMYYVHHEWMQTELHIAVEKKKPIIAIKPFGSTLIPTEVQKYAKEIVGWNTDSIVSAIRTHSL